MPDRYIYHITTNTGHSRKSYRSEVADGVAAMVADWLDAVSFEALPGYTCVVMYRTRDCMEAHVVSRSVHLVTIGVALDDRRCGAALWRKLAGDAPGTQPDQPWCAARIEPGLAADPEAAAWLGDFERCLAWGFDARKARG